MFASTLQRGHVDRPVLEKTKLTGKYDFDLEYQYDDTQFGGNLPPIQPGNSGRPDLFCGYPAAAWPEAAVFESRY
jgi:uncharacterized protein (TIGR03435 family)